MKPLGYGLLFVGSFNVTVSISVLVIGVFIFSLASWFSLGSLYLSKNVHFLCILSAYSCVYYSIMILCISVVLL